MDEGDSAADARPLRDPTIADAASPGASSHPARTLTPGGHRRRGRRGRRRWPWVAGTVGLLLVVLGFAAWAAASLLDAYASASQARSTLTQAQAALAKGDAATARPLLAEARDQITAADAAARTLPLKVASKVPWVGTSVSDVRFLMAAARSTTDGADDVAAALLTVDGPKGQPSPLLAGGRINLDVLGSVTTDLISARDNLVVAGDLLTEVRGTGPAGGRLATARDEAAAEVNPLRDTLLRAGWTLPLLPQALGEKAPRTYLVTLLGSGELLGSGGSALAAATITVADGRITVDRIDSTGSSAAISGANIVRYPTRSVFYNGSNAFAWSTMDPDFRATGYEMAESWRATTGVKVDGVIALDMPGVAAVLRGTGPIDGGPLGTLTADNFVRVMLVDSYREFGPDHPARKALNAKLMQRTLDVLTAQGAGISLLRSLADAVPGRHLQMWFADGPLEDAVVALGAGGRVADGTPADHVAVFTQNWNTTKNDAYQRRLIEHDVTLAADGSAQVTDKVAITWDTPDYASRSQLMGCYTGCWAYAYTMTYLPDKAEGARISITSSSRPPSAAAVAKLSVPVDRWKVRSEVRPDTFGRPVAIAGVWVAPDGTATQTVTYDLPPGTFSQPDGSVRYALTADPQPFAGTAQLRVAVTPPTGWTPVSGGPTSLDVALDRPVTWAAEVTPTR